MIALLAATILSCSPLVAVDGETGGRAKCERERVLAKAAKARLAELLRDPGLRIEDTGFRDKTSQRRPLVRVRLSDGRLAENVLLAEGHAIIWRPKVKRPWCG